MIMPQLIINTYVSLMYELKKNGKVLTSKSVRTGPSSYEKRIYRVAVSQRLRNTSLCFNVQIGSPNITNLFPKSELFFPVVTSHTFSSPNHSLLIEFEVTQGV